MMLPQDVNHRRWALVAKILLCGMFFNIHTCEASRACGLKNVLFVHSQWTSNIFPPAVDLEREGLKLCFRNIANKTQEGCGKHCKCPFKTKTDGENHILILDEKTLVQQHIVFMKQPSQEFSCMPSTLYNRSGFHQNKTSFLLNIHLCLKNGAKNIRLTKRLCNNNAPLYNCTDFTENVSKYIFTIGSTSVGCVLCMPKPEPQPGLILSLKVTVPDSQNTTRPGTAAQILKNISSLLDQMGNHSIATVTIGEVKGMTTKLPQQRQTKMNFGITASGDVNFLGDTIDSANNYSATVQIPKEASEAAVKANSSIAGVLLFPGMKPTDPSSDFLNNEVVGIEMDARIFNLSQTVDIQYNNVTTNGRVASCRSWSGDEEEEAVWIPDGCETVKTSNTITCQCTHLTFFAVLLSPPSGNITASDLKSLTYITSIGCGLSLFFLLVALFMHCLIRKGKASQTSQILINLFVAMSALNLSFLTNESISNLEIFGACVAIAAVMHYSLLATFTWFFMQALHLYFSLHKVPTEIKHYVKKICITGWVTPALVVIGLLASQKYGSIVISTDDGSTRKMCWISDTVIHQGVNIGYYAIVFLFTLTIFIVTVRQMRYFKSAAEKNQKDQDNSSTKSYIFSILGLVLLLGITWAFAFFSYGPLTLPSYYIFTILNSFQGFFLFIYYYKSSKTAEQDKQLKDSVSSTATSNLYVIKSPYG